MLDILLVIVSC